MMLYDGDQGGLLAVMEAGNLGQIRTGAASGLATRFMASEDADTVGILGTGFQARSQVEAMCAVRPIKRIRAFSRNAANREAFASRMSQRLDVEVTPATSAEECIRGADIAVTITDSRGPGANGRMAQGRGPRQRRRGQPLVASRGRRGDSDPIISHSRRRFGPGQGGNAAT